LAKNEEKAAQLRAKLLEKRATSTSRGPVPGGKEGISKPPPIPDVSESTLDEKHVPGVEVDNLVREAKEAAEAEAMKSRPYYHDTGTMQVPVAVKNNGKVSPAGSIISAPVAGVAEPSVALSKKAKKEAKKEAKKAKFQAIRTGTSEQQIVSTESPSAYLSGKKKFTSTEEAGLSGKQIVSSERLSISNGTDSNVNDDRTQSKNNIDRTNPYAIQAEGRITSIIMPSRSETLLSTSTIQQDTINGSERDPKETVFSIHEPNLAAPAASRKDVDEVTPLVRVDGASKATGTQSSLVDYTHNTERDVRSTAAYSHHFDDLDEWLEITGYHDRSNRDKVLGLYRRKAELDRQVAEVERELEQATVQRARSMREQLTKSAPEWPSMSSMAPPPTPTTGRALTAGQQSPKARSPITENRTTSVVASTASTKRPHSPDRGMPPTGPRHVNKLRRLSSDFNQAQTGASTLEVPSGPR
jgi:hypothetical protein